MKNRIALLTGLLLSFYHGYSQSWLWAHSGGANQNDLGWSITTDLNKNVYAAGSYYLNTAIFGTDTIPCAGIYDIYVMKYDSSGNFLWLRHFGGSDFDEGRGITCDETGAVYVAGYYRGPSLTFDAVTLTNSTPTLNDFYIVKLDTAGNVVWARNAIGSGNDDGMAVHADGNGGVYATGRYTSGALTFGTVTLAQAGNLDVFVVKYDLAGNVLWAKRGGGAQGDEGQGVSTDAAGNAYVTGIFASPSPTFGSVTLTNVGVYPTFDVFLLKYDPSGNLLWAKGAGGDSLDQPYNISTDPGGNSYITGYFQSSSISFGSITVPQAGALDMFLVKYDASGNPLWAKSAGGSANDMGSGVAVMPDGGVCASGFFASPTITFGSTTLTNSAPPAGDMFLIRYSASGNLMWARSEGGNWIDDGRAVCADSYGNIYLSAMFSTSMTLGTTTLTSHGGYDIAIAKFSETIAGFADLSTDDPGVSLFPLPTDRELILESRVPIESIEVYNLTGEKILFSMPNQQRTMSIDVSTLPSGIYFVKVVDEKNNSVTKKIVKM